ncbi:MAG: 5-(carboxyamino)imidazole ribonucleotide synthase [Candidatus Tyrphobacter sp.]
MIEAIGVIGGGQLGRMLALVAKRMGYRVVVLDPQPHSPCGQVADEQIVAAYGDLAAIEELGRRTQIVTYEFENIAIGSVEHLEQHGYRVTPAGSVLRVTQDRAAEKALLRACGVPTTQFATVERPEDLDAALAIAGLPVVIKTVRGGYDGKGQWRAASRAEAENVLREAGGAAVIVERAVDCACELSVVAARASDDEAVTFPVAENVHEDGILMTTVAPARISDEIALRAQELTRNVGQRLGIVGTYCVEFFLTRAGELLGNEIAPRPHNSGHFTIDVTPCSQYEQHVRAICGLPLSPPRMFSRAIMTNVLGDGRGDRLGGVAELLSDPAIVLHVYGKRHAVARRKMGHFTTIVDGPIDDAALLRAQAARAKLFWS